MNLYILGATGSIGQQTLDIVRASNGVFRVISVTANKSIDALEQIIQEFHPMFVGVGSKENMEMLSKKYPNIEFGFGEEGLIKASVYGDSQKDDLLVNALVGSVGLKPTVHAIKHGRNIALANKETLVIGGELIQQLQQEYSVTLLPLDSEHSAIMQCLQGEKMKDVSRLIITASGGSFRDLSRDDLKEVTIEQALSHPNWAMGAKITIDSATMMNKGFEVIEAHYLFGIEYDQIDTILHRESIIHSMVEFHDTSIIAHLGNPDMRVPINYALYYPKRMPYNGEKLNFSQVGQLHFEDVSYDRYPLFKMAIEAGKQKGLAPVTLNAANEAAVELFLNGLISFLEIESIVEDCLQVFPQKENVDLDMILQRDIEVKDYVHRTYR